MTTKLSFEGVKSHPANTHLRFPQSKALEMNESNDDNFDENSITKETFHLAPFSLELNISLKILFWIWLHGNMKSRLLMFDGQILLKNLLKEQEIWLYLFLAFDERKYFLYSIVLHESVSYTKFEICFLLIYDGMAARVNKYFRKGREKKNVLLSFDNLQNYFDIKSGMNNKFLSARRWRKKRRRKTKHFSNRFRKLWGRNGAVLWLVNKSRRPDFATTSFQPKVLMLNHAIINKFCRESQ